MDFEFSPSVVSSKQRFNKPISPYRQFCCPVSLISTSPSAIIPVSPRFSSEFDMLTFTAGHFEKITCSQLYATRKPPNGTHGGTQSNHSTLLFIYTRNVNDMAQINSLALLFFSYCFWTLLHVVFVTLSSVQEILVDSAWRACTRSALE